MTNPKNLVSVVLAVYNGEKFLPEALRSVFDQSYRPIEVIVLDDGSTDRTGDIVRSFENVQYFYQPNQGTAVARNNGVVRSRGDFIALLDADDIWHSNKLDVQVQHLHNHSEVGLVFAHEEFFAEPGTARPAWIKEEIWTVSHPAYIPSTMMARRTVFDQVGGFDSTFQSSPETDWLFRAKDLGVVIDVIPQVLLRRRIHQENLSFAAQKMMKDRLQIVRNSIRRQRNKL